MQSAAGSPSLCLSLSFCRSITCGKKGKFSWQLNVGAIFWEVFGACHHNKARTTMRERAARILRRASLCAGAVPQLVLSLSHYLHHRSLSLSCFSLLQVFTLPACSSPFYFQFHCNCCPDFWASKLCRSYVSLALHQGSPLHHPPSSPLLIAVA